MNKKHKKQPNKKEVSEPPSKRVAPAKNALAIKPVITAQQPSKRTPPMETNTPQKAQPANKGPQAKPKNSIKPTPPVKKKIVTPIDKKSFARIDAAPPDSKTKKSGFDKRAGKNLKGTGN